MKNYSISMKVIAVILTVIMIVGILPMTVFAQEFNETQLMKTVEIESDKKEKSPIVGEVTDKRDENTKVFERRDGSYTAVITSEPIHYDDNGEWKEIDNTLVKTNNKITNKENSFSVDFPRLDTLFLALPISWEGKVAQYAGRLHRDYPGKKDVRIYDYVDIHVPILERMYQKRLKGYASIGYKIRTEGKENSAPEIIYNNEKYSDVFCKDIMSAHDEILIVSPVLRKTAVRRIVKYLSKAISFGTSVKMITVSPTELKDSAKKTMEDSITLLRSCGVSLTHKPNVYQNFVVIDNRIVWFGNVNFLGYDSAESNVLRLVGTDIAMQLKDTLVDRKNLSK